MTNHWQTVTRFAPSPSGELHLGHAFSALTCYEAARSTGGRLLLRIEDIDQGRCRPEYVQRIYDDLHWLGIEWEQPVRRQSGHFDDYRAALARLDELGVLYPCFCTRADIRAEIEKSPNAPHGPDGPLYPGACRTLAAERRAAALAAGQPFALRIDVEKAIAMAGGPLTWFDEKAGEIKARPEQLGDAVLARKDVPTSYHLAVTVDDHLQGVTLIIRGRDLFHATHLHRLLQALLGYRTPRYHHHDLLTDENGQRLAKRCKSLSLKALREAGATPEDVKRMVAERPKKRLFP
ncbi:MAG: tRNA glutamyl-Q(34) synthetase GluQRS [Sphingomonadales bacterium]